MNSVKGRLYPAGSSRVEPLEVQVDDRGQVYSQRSEDLGLSLACHFSELEVPSRVGNSVRQVRFPDGSLFETDDNDSLDLLSETFSSSLTKGLAYRIESRLRYVLVSAAGMVAFIWFLMTVVLPGVSDRIATSLPVSVASSVGEGSLQIMDRLFFEPSELPDEEQQKLSAEFSKMVALADEEYPFQLVFRNAGDIGPNAFALPDGTIVVTDALVDLAESDEQISAVIAHEIGHVVHRHGLRRVFQSTGLSVLLVLVTGDIASAANLAAAIPALLLESNYSRDMESEADRYALEYLQEYGPAPARFAEIMILLNEWQSEQYGKDSESLHFLASHPATEERIQGFIQQN